jgi:hypothetical protein
VKKLSPVKTGDVEVTRVHHNLTVWRKDIILHDEEERQIKRVSNIINNVMRTGKRFFV